MFLLQAAKSTITALNVINLGASGAGILHSSYEVYIQWREENVAPSMLTVVQLSSSILFFGHAVYNFRTGAAIVEETQTRVLQEYQDGLRSNRLRYNMFTSSSPKESKDGHSQKIFYSLKSKTMFHSYSSV